MLRKYALLFSALLHCEPNVFLDPTGKLGAGIQADLKTAELVDQTTVHYPVAHGLIWRLFLDGGTRGNLLQGGFGEPLWVHLVQAGSRFGATLLHIRMRQH